MNGAQWPAVAGVGELRFLTASCVPARTDGTLSIAHALAIGTETPHVNVRAMARRKPTTRRRMKTTSSVEDSRMLPSYATRADTESHVAVPRQVT
jgi:hypothetical protein